MSSGSKLLCFYSIKMNSLFMFCQEWCCFYVYCGIRGHFVRDLWIQSHKCDWRGFVLVRALEWVTLGWFFQITLLQTGMIPGHTKEQENYRSYIFMLVISCNFGLLCCRITLLWHFLMKSSRIWKSESFWGNTCLIIWAWRVWGLDGLEGLEGLVGLVGLEGLLG